MRKSYSQQILLDSVENKRVVMTGKVLITEGYITLPLLSQRQGLSPTILQKSEGKGGFWCAAWPPAAQTKPQGTLLLWMISIRLLLCLQWQAWRQAGNVTGVMLLSDFH